MVRQKHGERQDHQILFCVEGTLRGRLFAGIFAQKVERALEPLGRFPRYTLSRILRSSHAPHSDTRRLPEWVSRRPPRPSALRPLRAAPAERALLADGAGHARRARVRSARGVRRSARHAAHQGRSARDRLARTRRRGEQPAGAGLDAAQDPRGRARSPPFRAAAIDSRCPWRARRRCARGTQRRRPAPADRRIAEAPASNARTNLPSRLPALYGRTDDLAAIAALLREHPVVTITGAGGIGKTRVAQAVASRCSPRRATDYPDGVWWVELAALTDGALVPSAVAQAMGVRSSPASRRRRRRVCDRSSRRSDALLVLDNCEHLADAVAALVDARDRGAPHVQHSRDEPGNAQGRRRARLSARRACGSRRRRRRQLPCTPARSSSSRRARRPSIRTSR